jgi:drug/metabolite transporter (DMT)-like permease
MRNIQIVGLALLCAAAWGVAPILIQAAMDELGGPSLWMLVLSQSLGALILAPLVWRRRRRILICPISRDERRVLIWLLIVSGLLEALFSIVFYFLIEQLGAVLTTITIATSPVFTILAGLLFLKERPGGKVLFAVAVTLAGVFLATVDRL